MTKRNLSEPLLAAVESVMSQLHVCMPGRIEDYEPETQRAEVTPLLRRSYLDGTESSMPVIAGVPVIFPRSGGASLTMPVKAGDGVQLIFADRSIDRWLAQGGEVTPDDRRKHALSDCIAVPGLYPFAEPGPQDNNDDVLLQYEGSEVRLTGAGDIEVKTGGAVSVETTGDATVTASGNINAEASGEIVASGAMIRLN